MCEDEADPALEKMHADLRAARFDKVIRYYEDCLAAAYESAKAAGHPLGRVPCFADVHDQQAICDGQRGTVEFCDTAGVLDYRLTEEGEG